jgi:uncharacterized protein YjeT (DUF2065 family)
MSEFVTAVGLVLVIEGLVYAFLPRHLKQVMATVERIPDETLRFGGVIAVAAGVAVVWIARTLIAGS